MAHPRILIFTETYYPVVGGGETQARLLAEGLISRGFSVNLLTRRSDSSLKKKEQYGEITVYRLSPIDSEHYKKWGLLLTSFPALINLRSKYDVIFVSGFRVIGVSAVLICSLFAKACILKADSLGEMSGDFFSDGLSRMGLRPSSLMIKVFLALRNKLLRKADAFVAICSDVAEELSTNGVQPRNIHRIPNGVDIKKFYPVSGLEKKLLRQKLNIPTNERVVIFTGRLVTYKGLPLLLRVWHQIRQIHKNVSLILLGSGGLDIHNCEKEIREYVESNLLKESVRFTGNVRNVHEYLQASDIFAFPTENEAFPLSVIEAMACGLPVVSTAVGGIKDVLVHGKNGLMVKPGDFQQLYDAIEMLIIDPALSACLGQRACETAQKMYATEMITQQYIDLFQRLIG